MIIHTKGALCPKLNNKNQNDKYIFFTCYFFAQNLERNGGGNVKNSKEEKRAPKQDITIIDIENKNILCEIKSFQRLKIFEKDENLFLSVNNEEYLFVFKLLSLSVVSCVDIVFFCFLFL